MKKTYFIIPVAAFLLFFVFWSQSETEEEKKDHRKEASSGEESFQSQKRSTARDVEIIPITEFAPQFQQSKVQIVNDPYNPEDMPPENELLKDLSLDEKLAMEYILELFVSCAHHANDGELPGLTNTEMTNILLGENHKRIAYLTEGHPRIDKNGQLTDKWGGAYNFHTISSMNLEITSPGPDGIMDTKDDVFLDLTEK